MNSQQVPLDNHWGVWYGLFWNANVIRVESPVLKYTKIVRVGPERKLYTSGDRAVPVQGAITLQHIRTMLFALHTLYKHQRQVTMVHPDQLGEVKRGTIWSPVHARVSAPDGWRAPEYDPVKRFLREPEMVWEIGQTLRMWTERMPDLALAEKTAACASQLCLVPEPANRAALPRLIAFWNFGMDPPSSRVRPLSLVVKEDPSVQAQMDDEGWPPAIHTVVRRLAGTMGNATPKMVLVYGVVALKALGLDYRKFVQEQGLRWMQPESALLEWHIFQTLQGELPWISG